MSKAAGRVHVSQPALSRQVALLEEELGVPLFDRIKKRIHLTEAGAFFLGRARQLLCDSETSKQQVMETYGAMRRTVRLGFITPVLDDVVAPAVREFQQRHPKSKVSLFDLPPRALLQRLKAHELDLAILGNIEEQDRSLFAIRKLGKARMAAVIPDDHPYAGRKGLKLALLKEESWVSLSDAFFPGRRHFFTSICQSAGFEPKLVAELESIPLLLAAVSTGAGVGLLPEHAKKFPHSGSVFIPLAAPAAASALLLVMPLEKPGAEIESLAALVHEQAQLHFRE